MVDSLDAQTALVRAEYDYYRALYDREIALAAVQRALGDGMPEEGGSR